METEARCYVCGRMAPTDTWLKPRPGTTPQTVRVFQPHPGPLANRECVSTGFAVLPAQRTPGRR